MPFANNATNYYTRNHDELYTQYLPTLNGRHQADFDYNGALDTNGDEADYYRPIQARKVG